MSNLTEIIGKEKLVGVTIDFNKIIKIMQTFNFHQKQHEQRLLNIESQLPNFVTSEVHSADVARIEDFQKAESDKMAKLLSEQSKLQQNLEKQALNLSERLEGSLSEMIVSQSITNKHNADLLDSRINHLAEQVANFQDEEAKDKRKTKEDLAKNFEEVNARVKHLYSQFMKHITSNNEKSDLDKLKDKISSIPLQNHDDTNLDNLKDDISKSILDDVDKRFQHFQEIFAPKDPPKDPSTFKISPSQLIELVTNNNFFKAALMKLTNDIEELNKKIDKVGSEKNSIGRANRGMVSQGPLDPFFDSNKKNDEFEGKLEFLKDSIDDIENKIISLNDHFFKREGQYRKIFYAIIDGLKHIHRHADGLEEAPMQDMSKIGDGYFDEDENFENNSSLYSMRFPPRAINKNRTRRSGGDDDDSDYEDSNAQRIIGDEIESNDVAMMSEEESEGGKILCSFDQFTAPSTANQPIRKSYTDNDSMSHKKKISGLLHLVTSAVSRPVRISPKNEPAIIVKNPEPSQISTQVPSVAVPLNLHTEDFVIADMDMELSDEPLSEVTLRELRFLLGQFKQQKDNLMISIDRKVDRDLVERLFDKFRVVFNELNDKEKELEETTRNFVTQKQYETLLQTLSNLTPNDENAGKEGQCLFCGCMKSRRIEKEKKQRTKHATSNDKNIT